MSDTTVPAFGRELRRWRHARRHSQLDLAVLADVSQRHLSHLETGRSNPSRDMVLQLAEALDLPLRARNELLGAAGFAALFPQRDPAGDDPRLRAVLQGVVDAHDAAPAYVVDRTWDLVLANDATARLTALLPDPEAAAAASAGNVLRLLLHPDGLRPHVVNFGEVAAVLLQRLRREVAEHGGDDELAQLLASAEQLAGTTTPPHVAPSARDLAVPLHLELDGRRLRLLTMIATIGAAHDVTLEELRIETLLPADDQSRSVLEDLRTAASERSDTAAG